MYTHPAEASHGLRRVTERLRRGHAPRPDEVALVLERGAEARRLLLPILTACAAWPSLPSRHVTGPLHALLLLAALEASEAWIPLEAILRKPFAPFVHRLFGEDLLESVPWAAARLALDQPFRLIRLVEDSELTIWIRVGALDALVVQAGLRPERRNRTIASLRGWLRAAADPGRAASSGLAELAEFLAVTVRNLGCATELRDELRALFASGRVDPIMIDEEDVLAGPDPSQPADPPDIFALYGSLHGSSGHDTARARASCGRSRVR